MYAIYNHKYELLGVYDSKADIIRRFFGMKTYSKKEYINKIRVIRYHEKHKPKKWFIKKV